MREAVCVSMRSSNDWAMLVVAAREGNDRRIVPMFWVCDNATIVPRCPNLARWRHAGCVHLLKAGGWTPAQCEEALKACVAEALAGVRKQYEVLAYKQDPGIVSDCVRRVTEKFQTLPNFPVGGEPAYAWFIAHDELAMRAHQFLRYLALGDSGTVPPLTGLTHEEKARLEENYLLRGDRPNWRNL